VNTLIWLTIIGLSYVCLLLAHGYYVARIAKRLVQPYLEYDGWFSVLQSDRKFEETLIAELVSGMYSPRTLQDIETYKTSFGRRDSALSDTGIIKFFIDQRRESQLRSLEYLTNRWTIMRDVLSKAKFVSHSDVINDLHQLLIKSGSIEFTMHDFSDWGKHEQPDYSSSLRWELRMLFDEGRIPKEKIYSGSY
jgi:hypothetical protein